MNEMKKTLSIIILISILLSFTLLSHGESKHTYKIPLSDSVPIIDGKGDDACWGGNKLTIYMDAKSCSENGGYSLNQDFNDSSTKCTIEAIWSNQRGKDGLYFKFNISDLTQSYAMSEEDGDFDNMDSIHILLDPLFKQSKTQDNCALDYLFTAYTAGTGDGIYPTGGAAWRELFQDHNNTEPYGIKVASALNKINNSSTEEPVIIGYTIEIYIPTSALKINNYEPTLKPGVKMGIGFGVTDYAFDINKYDKQDPNKSIILQNIFTDFGSGSDSFRIPQNYNILILADKEWNTKSEEDIIDNNQNPIENTGEAMFSLRESLVRAKNVANNENTSSYYTDSSLTTLKNAITAAEKITATNTNAQITAARQKLDNAYAALETKESLQDLLSRADLLVREDYTSDSWDAFVQAKNDAADYKDDENSEKGRSIKITLIEAIANLTPVTSDSPEEAKKQLSKLVSEAQTLKKSEYTQDSWNRLDKALTAAEDLLLSSNDFSAVKYESTAKALSEARNSLVKVPSKNILPIIIIIICVLIAAAGITTLMIVKKKNIKKYYRNDDIDNSIEPEQEDIQDQQE